MFTLTEKSDAEEIFIVVYKIIYGSYNTVIKTSTFTKSESVLKCILDFSVPEKSRSNSPIKELNKVISINVDNEKITLYDVVFDGRLKLIKK